MSTFRPTPTDTSGSYLWQPGSIEVRMHDSVALIRYRAQLEVVASGHHGPAFQCWHTDAYEKRDDAGRSSGLKLLKSSQCHRPVSQHQISKRSLQPVD